MLLLQRLSFMLRTRKWPSDDAMCHEAGRRFAEVFFRDTPLQKALRARTTKEHADLEPWLGGSDG